MFETMSKEFQHYFFILIFKWFLNIMQQKNLNNQAEGYIDF